MVARNPSCGAARSGARPGSPTAPGMHVGRGAQLERDPAVPDIAGQAAEGDPAVGGHGDVVEDAHPVAQPLGPAQLQGLPYRRQPEGFAGVHGGVEVLPLDQAERLHVRDQGIAGLGTGHVEAGHSGVAVAHGQAGDLQRSGGRAHGREQRPDHDAPAGVTGLRHPGAEAGQHGLDDTLQGQSRLGVQLRGEADLGVDDPVAGQVLARTPGRRARGRPPSASRRRCGRSLPGSGRGPAGSASSHEPASQLLGVVGRQALVAAWRPPVDQRGRPQAAVEMVVEEHLGARRICSRPGAAGSASAEAQPDSLEHELARARRPGRASPVTSHRAAQGLAGALQAAGVVGVQLQDGLPFVHRLARLDQAAHPGARAAPGPPCGPPGAQAPGGHADRPGFEAVQVPGRARPAPARSRAATGRAASGSPPWALTIALQAARAEPSRSARRGSPLSPASSSITSARATVTSIRSAGPLPSRHLHRLGHLEGIAHRPAEGHVHRREQRRHLHVRPAGRSRPSPGPARPPGRARP